MERIHHIGAATALAGAVAGCPQMPQPTLDAADSHKITVQTYRVNRGPKPPAEFNEIQGTQSRAYVICVEGGDAEQTRSMAAANRDLKTNRLVTNGNATNPPPVTFNLPTEPMPDGSGKATRTCAGVGWGNPKQLREEVGQRLAAFFSSDAGR